MDRERKVEEYVAQLESNPYDLAPLGPLEEAFDNAEHGAAELVALFEERAPEVASEDAAARLYLEAARIATAGLDDVDRGYELLSQSLTVGEDTLVSIEAYLFQLAFSDEDEELESFFAEALEHGADEAYRSRMYQRMGCILEDFVGDLDGADTAYKYALDLNPQNLAALWSRRDLARKQAAWDRVAELLIEEIERTEEPIRQAQLSVKVGTIYRDRLDAPESAEQCFAFAYEQNPESAEARQALREFGYDFDDEEVVDGPGDQDADLEDVAEEPVDVEAERTPEEISEEGDEQVEMGEADVEVVGEQLADEEIDEFGESEEALEVDAEPQQTEDDELDAEDDEASTEEMNDLEAEAGAGEPDAEFEEPESDLDGDDGAEEFEESAEIDEENDTDQLDEAAADDQPEDIEVGDDTDGSDVGVAEEADVDAETEAEADAADVDMVEETEEIGETEAEADDEFSEAGEVEAEESADEASTEDVEPTVEESGWRDRFEDLLQRADDAPSDEAVELLVRAANLQSRHPEDADDAVEVWSRAADAGVGLELYDRAHFLVDGEGVWDRILEAIEEFGGDESPELQARIHLFKRSDRDTAAELAESAGVDSVLETLEDLEEAEANWRKFQRSLEKDHADLDGDEKALRVYLRMADLAAALDDDKKEIDALRRLDRQVDDPRVQGRLKMVYRRVEKWPRYVDLVETEADNVGEDRLEDKIDLLKEVIRVYRQEMEHDRMAINKYKEILELKPDDVSAVDDLIELYGEMNMSSDLISMLQKKAELVDSDQKRVGIYADIAELFLDKFRNQAEAIDAYEKVLEIEPYNEDAISFLKQMYEKRRDWQSLIDVSKREIETLETDEEKAAGLKEVAELATDRLRKPDVATELWLEVFDVAPQDRDALDALEKLYEKKREYDSLAEILEHKVDLADERDEQMKLYQKLGMLYSDRLEDSEKAIEAWRGALDLDAEDLKARKALERLYIDNKLWEELEQFYADQDEYSDLVRVLGTLTSRVDDQEDEIELLLRSARIWREELDDTSRAERELEQVLEIDSENAEAAAQLEPIYEEAEDYGRLKDVLEISLSHLEEPAARKETELKLARLHRDEFDDWSQAFQWFARAFGEKPAEFDIVDELEEAAGHVEAWDSLVDHYMAALDSQLAAETEQTEESAEQPEDPEAPEGAQTGQETVLELRLLVGRVLSEELAQLDAALEQFQQVLDVEEDNLRALEAMEGIYRRSERWDDLMQVYRHRLELEEAVDARVSILQGMAHIAEVEAEDIVTAIARYNEALELDDRNDETLGELHRLYRQEGDYVDLVEVIHQEVDVIERRARTEARRVERRIVDPDDILGDGTDAESMFDAGDGAEDVGEMVADLHGESEGGDEFVGGESPGAAEREQSPVEPEQELEDGGGETVSEIDLDAVDMDAEPYYLEEEIERLTELRFELGQVCRDHLDDVDESIDALGMVLSWRPGHQGARREVESLFDDSLFREPAAEILEPVYEVYGEWEALVDVLRVQAEASEDPEESRGLYRRMAQIFLDEIGDGQRAFEATVEILEIRPDDDQARREAYRIAHQLDLWGRFVDACEQILPGVDDENLRVDYLYTLAQVNREYRKDYEEARRYLEEVFSARPEEMRALDELEELFVATEAWRDLLDVIDRKIELFEEDDAIEQQLFRKAEIWEQMLHDSQQAIAIYEQVLERDPENLDAYANLDRIYEYEGMWHELAEDLRRELELVDESRRHEIKNKLARVLEAHLDDADGAVDLYEEILDAEPENALANASMEELMHKETAPQERISLIMEPLYVERDDVDGLIDALEVQISAKYEADERVELLHRIADLHENRRDDIASGFQSYARALSEDVDRQDTLDALYRLAEEADGYWELVDVFEREADEQPDPDVQRDMLRRAATLYIDPIGELDQATDRLHSVLELFPADLETVEELEEIYRETEQWADLVDILVTKAELVDDPEERKGLFHQAGTLYEDILEAPTEAIQIYNRALEIDPADMHSIDRLEVLYTELQRWHDLLEIYRRKLELAEDDEARKDLLYVMGAIYRDHLEQPLEAVDVYRQILDLDGEDRQALEELDELYAETGQWHELLEILQTQFDLVAYEDEGEALKFRIGRLWEMQLNDGMKAVEVFDEILADNPNHVDSIEALEGMVERGDNEVEAARVLQPLYEEKGQWEELVRIQRLLIETTQDPERKIEVYRRIAEIVEDRLDDPAEAFSTYVEALDVDAGHRDVLETLERLAGELDGWSILVEQIDDRVEDITDFEVVAELHLRVARIFEEELDNAQRAIDRYRRVLEVEPEEQQAILALDRLYQREAQWEDLAEILKTRIYNSTDPEQTRELRLRLGTLYQTALEDAASAISTFQEVLLDDPGNETAIEHLEQMFADGNEVERIAEILEPYYVERNDYGQVVEIYLRRLELVDDPFQRFDLLMDVARMYLDELDSVESALETYGFALRERPDDEQVIAEIERLAEQIESWPVAAEIYADALESVHNTEDSRLGLWLRLARVLDNRLEAYEDAEMAYREVLEIEPDHQEALEALDRIYQQQARWEDLAEILRRRIESTYDEVEIVELRYRRAKIFQDQLGAFEEAVEIYERLLELQPDHELALEHLENIHTTLQAWEPLYDVLQRRAELTHDADEQADFYARMAQISEEMLGDKADATELWRRVLEIRPEDRQALGELRRLYLEDERWTDLVEVIRREVDLVEEPGERLGLFESMGTIYGEYLGDEIQAQDAWRSVLEIDPQHLQALEAMKGLTTRQADYQELAEIIERLLAHPEVVEERKRSLWEELAEVRGEMLMDPPAAIEAWKQVLGLDPEHDRALDELEELYLQESMWEEAANVLEIKAERAADEEQCIELLNRAADIWESKLFEPEEAARFYEAILEIDLTEMEASRSLEMIYKDLGTEEALAELAGLYLDRAEVLEDVFERMETLRNAARIFDESLQQYDNALVVLLSACQPETVEDRQLVEDIERLAGETGMWDDVVARFEEIADGLGDTPQACDVHRQIADWLFNRCGQPDEAVYHLQRAKMIEPENLEILKTLRTLFEELAAWPELAQVLQSQVELVSDPDEQIELWRRLGEVYETQIGDIDEAVGAYREILVIEPDDIEAMESLVRVFETFERWDELVEVLEQKAEATYDPDEIVDIKSRAAVIWEERLGQLQEAIATHRDVLSVDQSHEPALEALERLYMQVEQWNDLVDVYEQRLSLTHDPDQQVQIYGKMASVFENQFEDPNRAVGAYNDVLTVDPSNVTAVENLERLFRDLEQWFELADMVRRHIDLVDDADQKVSLLTELGQVQRNEIEDPHAAIEAFEQAVELEPLSPGLWSELAELYETTSNWERAVEAYERLVEQVDDNDMRVDVYHRLGQILEEQLHDHRAAEEAYMSALTIEPTHSEVLDAARELLEMQQQWQKLIDVLKTAEDHQRDLDAKAELLADIGKVYEEHVGDEVNALSYYEEALEQNPRLTDAAIPIVEVSIREKRFERAVPLLEMALEEYGTGDVDNAEVHRRHRQLAEAYEELAQPEKALKQYRAAYELDNTDRVTLQGLGRMLYERQEWQQASKVFQALQLHHEDELERSQLVEVYYRLGSIRLELDDPRKAGEYYDRALELEQHHKPTLQRRIEVAEAQNDYEGVVDYTRWYLDSEEDPTIRFAKLSEMGDILAQKLDRSSEAIAAYVEALEQEPDSVVVLRKLLDLYTKTKQWHEAVDILERIIEQEDNPSRIAKYYYTAAVIYRDEIEAPMEAVELFDKALDADAPNMLKAFEAIDRILTRTKQWRELARAYRRMLHRINEREDEKMDHIKVELWQNLGEVYRTRMGDFQTAVEAYKIAVGLDEENEKLRMILAELYEKTDDALDGIIEQHRELIKLDRFRVESYRKLFEAYLETKQFDRAWCMASALSFLQSATEQEETFFKNYLGDSLPAADGSFNDEMLRKLYHPEQDLLITFVMSRLGPGLRPTYSLRSIKDWDVHKRKDKVDLDEPVLFNKLYQYITRTLNLLPAPRVYLKSDQRLGMRNANVEPPAAIIGGDVRQRTNDRELAFTIAKAMTWMLPQHYMGSIGQPTEFLKTYFMGLMDLTEPSLGLEQKMGEDVGAAKKQLQDMPQEALFEAQKGMRKFLDKGENPNLSKWLRAVEHTAIRMALLLCGDIHTAADCIKSDLVPIGKAGVKDKIREMVLFSISEEYFELREQLGLAIGK